jgi:acyl-CoA thioester hydrolase
VSDSGSAKPGAGQPGGAWAPRVYRSGVDSAWLDYNGHMRDGYYAVLASASIDALMDELGIDAAYRRQEHCTLYTLEMHLRFLREIKHDDSLLLESCLLDCDAKRMQLLIAIGTTREPAPAAMADVMLMHVHQGETVRGVPFPAQVQQKLSVWRQHAVPPAWLGLGSRTLQLARKS